MWFKKLQVGWQRQPVGLTWQGDGHPAWPSWAMESIPSGKLAEDLEIITFNRKNPYIYIYVYTYIHIYIYKWSCSLAMFNYRRVYIYIYILCMYNIRVWAMSSNYSHYFSSSLTSSLSSRFLHGPLSRCFASGHAAGGAICPSGRHGSLGSQGHVAAPYWVLPCFSVGWLKGKSTGNHRFSHEIWDFPVFFPLNQ